MNNQARICNLKCKHNIQGVCYAYGECIAKDLFVAELEKIKTEIDNPKTCMFAGTYEADWIMENIIDKHIKELKGKCNAIK